MKQIFPFTKIMQTLQQLCCDQKTGTLYIVSETKRSVRFMLDQGAIIDAVTGLKHGRMALDSIKQIQQGCYSFVEGSVFISKNEETMIANDASLMSNRDVFEFLGITEFQETSILEHKQKILIVDDSALARKMAMRSLVSQGYQIIEAKNGVEALSQIALEKPDLVLLDIVMPGIDGYQVLSLIKNNQALKDIPIVMLTSRNKMLDKVKGKMSGSSDYLTKPFQAHELVDKVNHYLH